jgi:hypothetical protein
LIVLRPRTKTPPAYGACWVANYCIATAYATHFIDNLQHLDVRHTQFIGIWPVRNSLDNSDNRSTALQNRCAASQKRQVGSTPIHPRCE